MTTDRLTPALSDYIDMAALCRATLAGDDAGVYTIVANCRPGQLMQALVRAYVVTVLNIIGSTEETDSYFKDSLADMQKRNDESEQQ